MPLAAARQCVQKVTYLGGLVFGLALLAGCGWFASSSLEQKPQMFTDLPLPEELKVDHKNSQVYESQWGRVGILRASGRIAGEEVIAFYREVMGQNGWKKEGEFDNLEKQTLVYTKDARSAAISLAEGWFNTDVEINVSARRQ